LVSEIKLPNHISKFCRPLEERQLKYVDVQYMEDRPKLEVSSYHILTCAYMNIDVNVNVQTAIA